MCLLSITAMASNLPEKLQQMPIYLENGKTLRLIDFAGKKPVYLKFWATWCQPCRKEMPHFQHIQETYGDEIQVIGINLGINDNLTDVKRTQDEFALSMPMAIDENGNLAQNFRLLGTPYHLLFDKNLNLVHLSNAATEELDNKIQLITEDEPLTQLATTQIEENADDLPINLASGDTHILFFTATWCDWYLKDSRPSISQACSDAQTSFSQVSKQIKAIKPAVIVSRLWTGVNELNAYTKKYKITQPSFIDVSNRLFHRYGVKNLPTLVIVKNDKLIAKETNLINQKAISEFIQRHM